MDKPQPPLPEDFGTTAEDVASTPNFDDSIVGHPSFYWFWVLGIAACELWAADQPSVNDWTQHWLSYLILGVFLILPFSMPAAIAAMLFSKCFCSLLHPALQNSWPQYQRVTRFHKSQFKYYGALREYEAAVRAEEDRVRRQKEEFWTSLDGIAFERALGLLFKKMGYLVSTTPPTADGGVDLILIRDGEKIVVQCKAQASKVAIGTARELVASMTDFGAKKGILATTSGVTKPVEEYASKKNIEILDLGRILQMQRSLG